MPERPRNPIDEAAPLPSSPSLCGCLVRDPCGCLADPCACAVTDSRGCFVGCACFTPPPPEPA